ncbi:hypothetical protein M0R04_02725 [Candidatus Dojkabacteria bacterium]|jgi:hypothetical protein|nr:hypothetical protein [Candidatus Dojkabacteria bacterium]
MMNIKKAITPFILSVITVTAILGIAVNVLAVEPSAYVSSWNKEFMINGSFEAATRDADWASTAVKASNPGYDYCNPDGCGVVIFASNLPHTGDYTAFLGGRVDRNDTLTSSTIALDSTADKYVVSYYYRVYTQEADAEDSFRVAVYDKTSGHTEDILAMNNYTSDDISDNSWLSDGFDISGFVEDHGVTDIAIKAFGWNSEDAEYSSFFLDDISVLGSWGDIEAPTSNTISINSDATGTKASAVTLGLFSTDAISGIDSMRFSNNGSSWSGWYDYATTMSWDITSSAFGGSTSQGTKTVYVEFRDEAENASTAISDTIVYDTKAPTGTIKINAGASHTHSKYVTLNLSIVEANGGKQMRFSNNRSTWSAWEAYNKTRLNWKMTSSTYGGNTTKGKKYVYVQFKDAVGNTSSKYSDYIYYY